MKIRILIAAGILIAFSTVVLLWRAYHWDSLPRIRDAEQLRKNCVLLCQKFPLAPLNTNQMLFKELNNTNIPKFFRRHLGQEHLREIPKESWPNSIQELHPFRVTRDEYAISIWLIENSHHGAKGNWVAKGYYVHTNPSESPPRSATHGFAMYYLYETKYEGIDEFDLPAAVL